MNGVESIDEQLGAACDRRERALDLLIKSLIEIDGLTAQVDRLLDAKNAPIS